VARKRKSLKERAREAFDRARPGDDLRTFLETPRDWTDESVRAICANVALTLFPENVALRAAFKKTGLNHKNPLHWRWLLNTLVEVHFPSAKPRGARPKWDEARRTLFETDVARARKRLKNAAKRLGLPPPADDDVAAFLLHICHDRWGSISETSLRKYIVSGPQRGRKRGEN
jgi:hypothetical protein